MKYLSFIISIFITSFLMPFILEAQPLSVPTKVWQKTFGGSLNDVGNDILPLPDGGFLIAGYSESNDGDVTGHHGSAGVADGWIVRTNADGSIQWQKSFGGTGNDGFKKIIKTLDGNYAAAGWSNSTDGDISNAHGNYDIWMVKIDGNGSLLKSTCFGGSKFDSLGSFLQLPDQSFVFSASSNSLNGDIIVNTDSTRIWFWYFKIKPNDQVIWSKTLGNMGANYGASISNYFNGSLLISLNAGSAFYLNNDPFPTYDGFMPTYYMNIDTAGNIIWKKAVPIEFSRHHNAGGSFALTNFGLVLIYYNRGPGMAQNYDNISWLNLADFEGNSLKHIETGFRGSIVSSVSDVFSSHPNATYGMPDSSILYVGGAGKQTAASMYFDSLDGFAAIRSFKTQINPGYAFVKYGGSKRDEFFSIKPLSPISYITIGYTSSSDGDITFNHGGSDVWVVKLVDSAALRKNVVRGKVFRDMNNNGVFDGSDLPYRNILVTTKKTNSNQSVTAVSSAGIYNNEVDTGQYTTSSNFNRPYYTVTPATATTTFSGFDKADTVNFIVAPIPGLRDYYLNLSSQQILRVGRQLSYQLVYGNKGTDTLSNRTISFVKDNKFEFISSSPSPSSISGDTLRWTVASLLPDSQRVIAMTLRIPGIPPMPAFGDTLRSYGYIDSTLDIATGDNGARLEEIVSGSYDPNDKKESGLGKLYKDEYLGGKSLVYTIRFQNTGNDTAFRVVLRDQLSVRLKPESFELVGSSHPCKVKIENGKDVSWTFENINLPDSNRNEAASHGYVSFRIRPVSGLNVLDTIRNFAAIYFDYNEPVITNTEVTVIRDNPPPSPIISGLSSSYCSNQGTVRGKVMNLPLASSGITTQVKLDATALVVGADSSFQFTTGSLTAGNHLLTVTYTNTAGSKVLTYTVAIVATVTPDVNVTTNISYIDNLRDPITISAINAAGGGSTPLYTFARDRNFSNVIQAESTSKDLTLAPSFFSIGENLIYVKMKSSAPCFTVQIATDSIRLFRDEATGITDPDNPGKVINVYPNPIGNGSLYINGLDALKSYELQLSDMKGRLLAKRQVKGTVQVEWPYAFSSSGVYLISVIDARKKTPLGTIKIIKK